MHMIGCLKWKVLQFIRWKKLAPLVNKPHCIKKRGLLTILRKNINVKRNMYVNKCVCTGQIKQWMYNNFTSSFILYLLQNTQEYLPWRTRNLNDNYVIFIISPDIIELYRDYNYMGTNLHTLTHHLPNPKIIKL